MKNSEKSKTAPTTKNETKKSGDASGKPETGNVPDKNDAAKTNPDLAHKTPVTKSPWKDPDPTTKEEKNDPNPTVPEKRKDLYAEDDTDRSIKETDNKKKAFGGVKKNDPDHKDQKGL